MSTYGSLSGVQAINPAVGTLDTDSTPTSDQATTWLAEGYAEINRYISAAGYSVPVSSSAALYASLTALNDLYAAAYVLRSRGFDLTQGEQETRSETYLRDFYSRLKGLATMDLSQLGADLLSTPGQRRRRIRSLQLRRIDGYSAARGTTVSAYDKPSD